MPPGQRVQEVLEEKHQGSGNGAIGGGCWEEDKGALLEDGEKKAKEGRKRQGRKVEG